MADLIPSPHPNDSNSLLARQLSPELSHAFSIAQHAAGKVLRRRFRVLLLVRDAYDKASGDRAAVQSMKKDLFLLLQLMKDWALGRYTSIPWKAMLYAGGAVLYFVCPTDLIPDVLPGIGYLDDAAVVGAAVHAIRSDLNDFHRWKRQSRRATTGDGALPTGQTIEIKPNRSKS